MPIRSSQPQVMAVKILSRRAGPEPLSPRKNAHVAWLEPEDVLTILTAADDCELLSRLDGEVLVIV